MIQPPLPGLQLRYNATFDNFYVGSNTALVSYLRQPVSQWNEQFVYLWGEEGVGKTHLLQACCHTALKQNREVFYLPLSNIEQFSPKLLNALEQFKLILVDDIQTIAGCVVWEEAFFHLYNRVHAAGAILIASAIQSPHTIPIQLADLRSRLCSGLTFQVQHL